jgi:hypothetical protein
MAPRALAKLACYPECAEEQDWRRLFWVQVAVDLNVHGGEEFSFMTEDRQKQPPT